MGREIKLKSINNQFAEILLDDPNIASTQPHGTNLVLHTRYILAETNTMLTLYILQGESGASYLCDIGSIFDTAEDLGLDRKIVVANAAKFGLQVDQEKIYCQTNQYDITSQVQDFIDFVKHLALV